MVRSSKSIKEKIPLFWWSEPKLMGKKKENYGDLISKYLVEKMTSRKVKWVQPKKQAWYILKKKNYLTAGSIIHHANKHSIVWGSGIIDRCQPISPADFRAVRGPQSRNFLLRLGYQCPEVYGDPAILLPLYYHPQVDKKYEIGIIPHYHDFEKVYENYKAQTEILVIDLMTLNIEEVTRRILECKRTISSSLHGMIVSHAYGTPSVWLEFSDKLFGDGVKFADYLESVGLTVYKPMFSDRTLSLDELIKLFKGYPAIPKPEKLQELQQGLLATCPF